MAKKQNPAPRTCATHNPGSPDCGPNCPDVLRDPAATPGLVFAMADGTKVGAPADVARAQQMTRDVLETASGGFVGLTTPRNTASSPEVGPESVEDMDDAVHDIEQRDDDSDEVDTDIEGDDDDGPMEPTDDEQAEVARRDELRDENANLRLRVVELERANGELTRRLAVMRSRS